MYVPIGLLSMKMHLIVVSMNLIRKKKSKLIINITMLNPKL